MENIAYSTKKELENCQAPNCSILGGETAQGPVSPTVITSSSG